MSTKTALLVRPIWSTLDFITLNSQQWHVICITGSGQLMPQLIQKHAKTYLHLIFDDIDCPLSNYIMPSIVDVKSAIEYAKDKTNLIVCCEWGHSRSKAIAYAIECQRCGNPKVASKLFQPQDFPNKMIVKFAASLLGDKKILDVYNDWIIPKTFAFGLDNG